MPKNCGVCSDSPCERDVCKRELFKIEGCNNCPAKNVCSVRTTRPAKNCPEARKIEKLVNERGDN